MGKAFYASSTLAVIVCLLLAFLTTACGGGSTPPPPPPPKQQATLVSGPSPFQQGCDGSGSTRQNYGNAEVEAWLALDPTNSSHLIGIHQQDRWHGSGAHGIVIENSRDGGKTWTRSFATFAHCEGGNAANGGDYEIVSDPWVSISPAGTVFQSGLPFNVSNPNQGMAVSRSLDGGDTWSAPATLTFDNGFAVVDDKDSVTADPTRAGYAYVIWSRYTFTDPTQTTLIDSPAWLARTTDNGATWEPARLIYEPPLGFYTLGHEIVVLPDGTLVDMFNQYDTSSSAYYVMRSNDAGLTWSAPIQIDVSHDIGITDTKTGEVVREGVANIAVNPANGNLYFVSMDARFSSGARNGIALYTSSDGGLNWSAPAQVNQAPNVQAFAPSVAVSAGGRIAVTYYDFRNDTSDPNVLLTTYWRIASSDNGRTWAEIALTSPFDLRIAPVTSLGFMITDYEGLVAVGENFTEFFIAANTGNTSNPTDVYTTNTEAALGSSAATPAKAAAQHVETNSHPRTTMQRLHPAVHPRPD
jgi:hypothetical protein